MKYWLFVIPDHVPQHAGRAIGRLGFASDSLLGPYRYCNWLEQPVSPQKGGECGGPDNNACAWPGDIIKSKRSLYFVNGWGNIFVARTSTSTNNSLAFTRLEGQGVLTTAAPPGNFDDIHQIEFTFLPPVQPGGRYRLYHASYSMHNGNPNATRADYGYKQAIGMYSFAWS